MQATKTTKNCTQGRDDQIDIQTFSILHCFLVIISAALYDDRDIKMGRSIFRDILENFFLAFC